MERDLDLRIYLGLVVLTLATAASSLLHLGRLAAVGAALAVASVKAGLIGAHFMHLKDEGPVTHAIVLTGLTALIILTFGILPDMMGTR